MGEAAASPVEAIENLDGTRTDYFEIDPTEERLLTLLRALFEDAWNDIICKARGVHWMMYVASAAFDPDQVPSAKIATTWR